MQLLFSILFKNRPAQASLQMSTGVESLCLLYRMVSYIGVKAK